MMNSNARPTGRGPHWLRGGRVCARALRDLDLRVPLLPEESGPHAEQTPERRGGGGGKVAVRSGAPYQGGSQFRAKGAARETVTLAGTSALSASGRTAPRPPWAPPAPTCRRLPQGPEDSAAVREASRRVPLLCGAQTSRLRPHGPGEPSHADRVPQGNRRRWAGSVRAPGVWPATPSGLGPGGCLRGAG